MDHVDHEDDVREAQSNDLHKPEAEERDRGKEIVAHICATRLNRVAHEPLLLVLVQGVPGKEEYRDAEEDHHNEPHLPWKREAETVWCASYKQEFDIFVISSLSCERSVNGTNIDKNP